MDKYKMSFIFYIAHNFYFNIILEYDELSMIMT